MAQQVQHTETSTMIKATKVADYIVERIAAEGISHCFGVAGDYVFPICDAVDSSPKVKWIGCANELNASYAADGYARIRGAAMLATTYGVGELSALNGVMGAKAERSLVFHVVGLSAPARRQNRPSHAWRWRLRQFRRFVRQRSMLSCDHHSGKLRARIGTNYR
jgi:TPP-dependent 2-oxoacid decarboxylase